MGTAQMDPLRTKCWNSEWAGRHTLLLKWLKVSDVNCVFKGQKGENNILNTLVASSEMLHYQEWLRNKHSLLKNAFVVKTICIIKKMYCMIKTKLDTRPFSLPYDVQSHKQFLLLMVCGRNISYHFCLKCRHQVCKHHHTVSMLLFYTYIII